MANHLSLADVLALHTRVMIQTQTPEQGLRDEGLLESAIHRPRMAEFYEGADLIRQAALLAVGISQSQPFVEGNKRTAYIAADVFLRLNGQVYSGEPVEMGKQLELLAEWEDDLDSATNRFEVWLRENVSALDA